MKRPKRKTDTTPGGKLRTWLAENFDFVGCEPMIEKLCDLEDDLAAVRGLLEGAAGDDKPGLLRLKLHLLAQYTSIWKTLGLADDRKNPVGRPLGT